ncbi:hypothetical protein QTP88_004357 [Uroleucon formosanum]
MMHTMKWLIFASPVFQKPIGNLLSKKYKAYVDHSDTLYINYCTWVRTLEDRRSSPSLELKPTLWYYDLLLFTKDQEIPTDSISNLSENECPVMNEPMLDDDESNDITDNIE